MLNSLIPFDGANKWGVVSRVPDAKGRVLPALGRAASALVAFTSWIGNQDRVNDGNLIVAQEPGNATIRFAYIDHGHALAHSWGEGPCSDRAAVVGPYPGEVRLDKESVSEMVAAIKALSDNGIRSVVARLPDGFIDPKRRNCIGDGLCRRKEYIRDALAPVIGGKP